MTDTLPMPSSAALPRSAPTTQWAFPPTLALVTLGLGTFLPLVTKFFIGVALANPIWGSLYGLGFWIWEAFFGLPGFGNLGFVYAVFGAALWPLSLTVAVALGLKSTLERTERPYFVVGGWIVSALVIFPLRDLSSVPIYITSFR